MKSILIVFTSITLSIGLLIAGYLGKEFEKAYWDRTIDTLCDEDGGVHLIEKIRITPQQARQLGRADGHLALSPRNLQPEAPAYKDSVDEILNESDPRVLRTVENVFRSSDGMHMGSIVSYRRIGGDFPTGIFATSSAQCPEIPEYFEIQSEFFEIQGDE